MRLNFCCCKIRKVIRYYQKEKRKNKIMGPYQAGTAMLYLVIKDLFSAALRNPTPARSRRPALACCPEGFPWIREPRLLPPPGHPPEVRDIVTLASTPVSVVKGRGGKTTPVLRIRIILIRIRIQNVKKFVTDPDPGKNDTDPDPAKKA